MHNRIQIVFWKLLKRTVIIVVQTNHSYINKCKIWVQARIIKDNYRYCITNLISVVYLHKLNLLINNSMANTQWVIDH